MENLNDLATLEEDLVNKKKQKEKETPTKKSPFAKKTKMDFGNFSIKSSDKLKNIDIKKDILSKLNIISVLWVILIILGIYSYNTDVFKKVEQNPTLIKNLSIIKGNIEKQNQELESLEKINLDNSTLTVKEELLDKNLSEYSNTLYIEQSNTIYQIAKEVGLELESLQKIEVRRDDQKIDEFGIMLEDKGIENFYEKAWYTKFILTTISSEEVIFRFKEKVEDKVGFVFDGFGINQSDGEIKYSFSLKAFYNLKNENEQIN